MKPSPSPGALALEVSYGWAPASLSSVPASQIHFVRNFTGPQAPLVILMETQSLHLLMQLMRNRGHLRCRDLTKVPTSTKLCYPSTSGSHALLRSSPVGGAGSVDSSPWLQPAEPPDWSESGRLSCILKDEGITANAACTILRASFVSSQETSCVLLINTANCA